MWIYLVMVLLVAADQAIKYWARNVLMLKMGGQSPFLGRFLDLYYAENTGAAFSIFRNGTVFFIIVTAVFLIVLAYVLVRVRKRKIALLNTALAMIIAGGIGNLIDRVSQGYVIDMFHFGSFEFPIFNFADTLITIGAVLLFVFVLFFYEKHFPGKKKKEEEAEIADAEFVPADEETDEEEKQDGVESDE